MRTLLIHLVPKNPLIKSEINLEEIKGLLDTYGTLEIIRVIQRKDDPSGDTYIGRGKVQEITRIITEEKIDAVIISNQIKPSQIFNLQQIFFSLTKKEVEVWDRIMLILKIFEKHAKTSEAKLQIELARMRHMGPRIYGLGGTFFSRQGGGVGTRGIGETNIELMKRHWSREIKKVNDKLQKLEDNRAKQLVVRKEKGITSVAIVGYTNAGKTTLFNALTGKNKYVQNELFATLDSVTGKCFLPNLQKEILVSDTIGFMSNLPLKLIQAFKSTLLESIHADLLLHVIDICNKEMKNKIVTVNQILSQISFNNTKTIYVFNKIDLLENNNLIDQAADEYQPNSPVFISSAKNIGLDELFRKIESAVEFVE